jgi:hypothetical protein
MTPKQKANDLIHKFFSNALPDAVECDLNVGKQCALIAVEEILTRMIGSRAYSFNEKLFWSEVKSELQSL